MTIRRPRRALVVVALLAGGLLVTGCSAPQAGSAALIGDSRISEADLTDQVQAVLVAQRQPVNTPNQALTATTLSHMITIELVDRLSTMNGIVVTQGEIDEALAKYDEQFGGRAAVLTAFAEQDVAPSQIEPLVRMNLQAQALGIKLDPHGTAEEQGQAVFASVGKLSDELKVTASPRFGTWDPTALKVGLSPDDLTALPAQAK